MATNTNTNEISISSPPAAPAANGNGDPSTKCRMHVDHEHRIAYTEAKLAELKRQVAALAESIHSPKIIVAVIGLLGVTMATCGSIFGTLLVAYLKAKGYM